VIKRIRKLLTLSVAIIVVVTLLIPAIPAMAAGTSVGTQVTIASGSNPPVVLAKWEADRSASLEDGDPTHVQFVPGAPSNSQFLPPVVKNGNKTVDYYAVVTDPTGWAYVKEVFAYVFSPVNSPAPYNNNPNRPNGVSALFKYKVAYADLEAGTQSLTGAQAKAIFDDAVLKKLIYLGAGANVTDISNELNQGVYHLWKGSADLTYEQPAGEYGVDVYAVNNGSAMSSVLHNTFTYVAVAGVEVDFTLVDYGIVNIGTYKLIPGDQIWGTAPATIRNIGNTWAHPKLSWDDMGFGQTGSGAGATWNVQFDSRLGVNGVTSVTSPQFRQTAGGLVSTGVPAVVLADYLGLSTREKLDFSIQVFNMVPGKNSYTGTVTIEAVAEPFGPGGAGSPTGVAD